MYDLTILGAGVSGAAIAWQAARYQLSVCVLEKENDIACGTTKANSAIIHAGYDPMPGTLMAKLNVRGNAMELIQCFLWEAAYQARRKTSPFRGRI